jgi:hypothetical protein
MSFAEQGGPGRSRDTAARLAALFEEAEREALNVIDEAEREARRRLEEAEAEAHRVAAGKLREAADLLEREAGGVQSPPRSDAVPEPPPAPAPTSFPPQAPPPPIPEEPPRAPRLRAAPDPRPGGSAAARLLATQMAVSGSSRKEIEMRLRNGFEIEDTSEILDAILGPE